MINDSNTEEPLKNLKVSLGVMQGTLLLRIETKYRVFIWRQFADVHFWRGNRALAYQPIHNDIKVSADE